MTSKSYIHVLTGWFASGEEASAFAHPHWETEPAADASDEEYAVWEDRNPIWPMRSELCCSLDSDFIDVIWSDGDKPIWECLAIRLNATEVQKMDWTTPVNTLVLIDQTALRDETVELRSTSRLTYRGRYLAATRM